MGTYSEDKILKIIELPKRKRGRPLGSLNKNLEEVASEIREAIANGANSINAIKEKTKYSYPTIKKYAEKNGIELPLMGVGMPRKERLELDSLINEGFPLREIGEFYGVTAERARQVIDAEGKTEAFKESRNKQRQIKRNEKKEWKQERKQELAETLWYLDKGIQELAQKEGWAYQKAVEYLNKPMKQSRSRLRKHSFEDLLILFNRYEEAQKNGQKLSLYELSQDTGFAFPQVGKILEDVGVLPMNGDKWKGMERTPEYKKEAIKRAVEVNMPVQDIAYFLGVPHYTVRLDFVRWGLRDKRPQVDSPIKIFGARDNSEWLTYRLASEIYEAKNRCKFNRDETAEVLDVSRAVVDYALEHRGEIEPVIVESLRVLYGYKRIKKPYKKNDF